MFKNSDNKQAEQDELKSVPAVALGFVLGTVGIALVLITVPVPEIFRPLIFSDVVRLLQALTTTFVAAGGGIWFLRQRKSDSRLDVSHDVFFISEDAENELWGCKVKYRNIGKVQFKKGSERFRVSQLAPVSADFSALLDEDGSNSICSERCDNAKIPSLVDRDDAEDDMKIGPGEADSRTYFFRLPSKVSCIEIYSHVAELEKEDDGWSEQTVLSTKEPKVVRGWTR
ncbi:MAG: hypothetical protein GY822_17025 [Deltaproteobacteria bacterium]|nr:hypothetical protein [Deltaproteobacteria bacterium]